MNLGEGAGFVVLEDAAHAGARGVEPWAELLGVGYSSDGYHATAPDPTGAGVARALRAALEHAGLSPSNIGYLNAHGTGTEANDAAEWRAIERVFGASSSLPVSSTKSYFGHLRHLDLPTEPPKLWPRPRPEPQAQPALRACLDPRPTSCVLARPEPGLPVIEGNYGR